MVIKEIAVLLTCHNRKEKTITCLKSLLTANIPVNIKFDIYLVDDGSKDGTSEEVTKRYPQVKIIYSKDNLYWAGGMRLAWSSAQKSKEYDGFLLINDDVELTPDFYQTIITTQKYSLQKFKKEGIYVCSTKDKKTGDISYGGRIVKNKIYTFFSTIVIPKIKPISCQMTNANILYVDKSVVDKIGILNAAFTHGIADYDYSLKAYKYNIPVLVCPNIGGFCEDDHGNNWTAEGTSLKKRIKFLYSPKGLAYKEYLFFIKSHFPLALPYSFTLLWLKTFFPILWVKFKKKAH